MEIETFLSLSTEDMNLYYAGTFLPFKTSEDEPQWGHVHSFSAHGATIKAEIITAKKHISQPVNKIKWNFDFPAAGNYNFRNSVIMFYRNPARVTHKAIHNHTALFRNLMRPLCVLTKQISSEFFMEHEFQLAPEHLNELFPQTDKKEIPFGASLEKILKKQALARRVNERISISQGVISKHPSLWLKDRLIGQLDMNKLQILPVHDLFVPELKSTFAPLGFVVRQ